MDSGMVLGSPVTNESSKATKEILCNLNLTKLCRPARRTLQELTIGRQRVLTSMCTQGLYISKCTEASVMQTRSTLEFHIGIIGVGQVGRKLLNTLLAAGYAPRQVSVTSRQPDLHSMQYGEHYCNCALEMIRTRAPRIIFIACQGAHLTQLSKEVKGHLKSSVIVCSMVAGTGLNKLKMLLGTENVCQINVLPFRLQLCDQDARAVQNKVQVPRRLRDPVIACVLDNLMGISWRSVLPDKLRSAISSRGKTPRWKTTSEFPEPVQHILSLLCSQSGALGLDPGEARCAACTALINPMLVLSRKERSSTRNQILSQTLQALENSEMEMQVLHKEILQQHEQEAQDKKKPETSTRQESSDVSWTKRLRVWKQSLVDIFTMNFESIVEEVTF